MDQFGTFKCWGRNDYGGLGFQDTMDRGTHPRSMGDNLLAVDLNGTAVSVARGEWHACALLEGGFVKCWGLNDNGQLGYGDTRQRGDNEFEKEMGAGLPVVKLNGVAIAVALGTRHSCAILEGGFVKCWGYNNYGQLGLGHTANRGDGPEEMGAKLPGVDLGGWNATAIACGEHFSCVLLSNEIQSGFLKCWGYNAYGQLGQGHTSPIGDGASEMGAHLSVVDLNGTAVSVLAGLHHVCVILDDGSIKCWGRNHNGQLGYGDILQRGDNANEMGAYLPPVEMDRSALELAAG
ncbi:regulator of chromosome condensation 1/beta-lactamase-inhibitor protein II, partial [Baffinella frigidus]